MQFLYGYNTSISKSVARKVVLPNDLNWCPNHVVEMVKKAGKVSGEKATVEANRIVSKLKHLPSSVQMSGVNAVVDMATTSDVWKETAFGPYIYQKEYREHMRWMLDKLDLENKSKDEKSKVFVNMRDLREGKCGGKRVVEWQSDELFLKDVAENLQILHHRLEEGLDTRDMPTVKIDECVCATAKIPINPDTVSDGELSDEEEDGEIPKKRMRLSTTPDDAYPFSRWTIEDILTKLNTYNNLVVWARVEIAAPRVRDRTDQNLQVAHWLMMKMCHLPLPDKIRAAYHLIDILPNEWCHLPIYKTLRELTSTWSRMDLPLETQIWLADEFCVLKMVEGGSYDEVYNPDFTPPRVSQDVINQASRAMVSDMMLNASNNKVLARDFFYGLCNNFTYGAWLDTVAFKIMRYYCNPFLSDSIFPVGHDSLQYMFRKWAMAYPENSAFENNLRRRHVGILKIAKRLGLSAYTTQQAIAQITDFLRWDELIHWMSDADYGLAAILMTYNMRCTTDDFWRFMEILQPGFERPIPGSTREDDMMNAVRKVRRFPVFHITVYDVLMWIAKDMPETTPTNLRKEIRTAVLMLNLMQMNPNMSQGEIGLVRTAAACLAVGRIHHLKGNDPCNPFHEGLSEDDREGYYTDAIPDKLITAVEENWTHPTMPFDHIFSIVYQVFRTLRKVSPLLEEEMDLLEGMLDDWEGLMFEDLANIRQETVTIKYDDPMLATIGDRTIQPTLTLDKVDFLHAFDREMFQGKYARVRPPKRKEPIVCHSYSARHFGHL